MGYVMGGSLLPFCYLFNVFMEMYTDLENNIW